MNEKENDNELEIFCSFRILIELLRLVETINLEENQLGPWNSEFDLFSLFVLFLLLVIVRILLRLIAFWNVILSKIEIKVLEREEQDHTFWHRVNIKRFYVNFRTPFNIDVKRLRIESLEFNTLS